MGGFGTTQLAGLRPSGNIWRLKLVELGRKHNVPRSRNYYYHLASGSSIQGQLLAGVQAIHAASNSLAPSRASSQQACRPSTLQAIRLPFQLQVWGFPQLLSAGGDCSSVQGQLAEGMQAIDRDIHDTVSITRADGMVWELVLPPDCTSVRGVRALIAHQLGVPMAFQRLLKEDGSVVTEIPDFDLSTRRHLEMNLVISVEEVVVSVEQGDFNAMLAILSGAHLLRGNERVIAAVTASLEADHTLVRRDGCKALSRICPRGDQRAIAAVTARLGDPDELVRVSAVDCLRELAHRGDRRVITAVGARSEDEDEDVRRFVALCLKDLVPDPMHEDDDDLMDPSSWEVGQ